MWVSKHKRKQKRFETELKKKKKYNKQDLAYY